MTDAKAVDSFPRLQCGWCAAVLRLSAMRVRQAGSKVQRSHVLRVGPCSPGARDCGCRNEGRVTMGTHFIGLRRLRAALLGCAAVLACASAHAQERRPLSSRPPAVTLETIDVNPTSSRLSTSVPRRPARERERRRRAARRPRRRRRRRRAGPSEPATPGAVVRRSAVRHRHQHHHHRRLDDGHHRGRHRSARRA